MDWIVEYKRFFVGVAVGSWVVLMILCFVVGRLRLEVKYLEGIGAAHYERTDPENDDRLTD